MAEVKTYNREFSRVTSRTAVTGIVESGWRLKGWGGPRPRAPLSGSSETCS